MLPCQARTALFVCAGAWLAAGCGSDGGTGPEAGEPASITVENGDLTLDEEGQQVTLVVTVADVNGDPVMGSDLIFFSEDPNVASVSQEGLVTAVGNGGTDISVAVGRFSDVVRVTVEIPTETLELDVEREVFGGSNSARYFTVEVPASTSPRALLVRAQGGTGDADIRIRLGEPPTPEGVDCESPSAPQAAVLNLEFCAVTDPDAGTWHILLQGFDSFAEVRLDVSVVPIEPLDPGVPSSALSGGRNDVVILQMLVPPLNPAASVGAAAPGTLSISTAGGTGDADLFATPFTAFSFYTIRFMPCVSDEVGNVESCEIDQPDNALWSIFLIGYEAFEGVMVTADYSASSGAG